MVNSANADPAQQVVPKPAGKQRSITLALIALLLVLGTAGLVLYVITHYFGVQWSVLATAGSALVVWLVRADVEKRREYERLLNQQKRDQYAQFIDVMNTYLPIKDEPEQLPPSLSDLRKWSMKLMLVGSDDVVRAWNTARITTDNGRDVIRNYGRMLLAMRRDSGHHHTKLKPSDMLGSFINDVHEAASFFDE
jgi:hypothetical protein